MVKNRMLAKIIIFTIVVSAAFNSIGVLRKNEVLAGEKAVLYKALADRVEFSDRYFVNQWGLDNDGSLRYSYQTQTINLTRPAVEIQAVADIDINLPEARAKYKGLQETVVAVIDTGADLTHEDLSGALWINRGEIADNGIDDDGNGYIDDINGWNFYDDSNNIYNGTEDNHGTNVTGIIAADLNDIGIAGVAGSSNVKVMVLKALGENDGSGYTYNITSAIRYAEANGAVICNLSLGAETSDRYLEEAIKESKMLFVVAAGNGDEYTGLGYSIDERQMYPASYDFGNIISVANLEADGRLHETSNYGSVSVDLAAPGTRILTPIASAFYNKNATAYRWTSPYAYVAGTSMAAPMVSGVAALIHSAYPGIEAVQIKEAILSGVKRVESLSGKVLTGGMLDASGAMDYAADNYNRFLALNNKTEEKAEEKTEEKTDNISVVEDKGTAPTIKFSISKTGKVTVKVRDKEGDISEVRYSAGKRSLSYFTKSGKGVAIKLNAKNNKTLSLKKGKTYTFYVIDTKGNTRIAVVTVK